ncbi:MAG: geranylgeranylglycerol-phosphate geranylgeranyltransferase [Cyclobacteriaceae bacterium]|nr:geranylgeranylglycerol-phosphate geranylgeranyltransferase [Cyclobacteriaceae bacterium]
MVPLQALVRLTRIWNLMIIALAQYAAASLLISPDTWKDPRLALLVLSTVIIAAGGYSINDYYDIKIDLINKPDRVIVGKILSRRFVLLLHTVCSVSGVMIGFVLDWRIGIVNFLSAFFLWWYSNALKRLPFSGNFIVALLTGMAVIVVNMLYPPMVAVAWVYALFAFFMTLIREIIKDMEDLKGDDTFGCKTLPIIWGIRGSKLFVYLLLVIFFLAVIAIHMWVKQLPVPYFLGCLFLPMGIMIAWLIRADTKKDFHLLSQFCKIIMLVGIFSMAFV